MREESVSSDRREKPRGHRSTDGGAKDLPIIMSAPMVRACLREAKEPGMGKTMTRRLAWVSETDTKKMSFLCDGEARPSGFLGNLAENVGVQMTGAYYLRPSAWNKVKVGDRLWVRERITRFDKGTCDQHCWYHAGQNGEPFTFSMPAAAAAGKTDGDWPLAEGPGGGKPYNVVSIHMPRMFSRLTLIVSCVKVERLQAITEADCLAEGPVLRVGSSWIDGGPMVYPDPENTSIYCAPRTWFRELWDTLHGPGAWDENPYVVSITFKPVLANVDDLVREAA
jgi:hypothetical protein